MESSRWRIYNAIRLRGRRTSIHFSRPFETACRGRRHCHSVRFRDRPIHACARSSIRIRDSESDRLTVCSCRWTPLLRFFNLQMQQVGAVDVPDCCAPNTLPVSGVYSLDGKLLYLAYPSQSGRAKLITVDASTFQLL